MPNLECHTYTYQNDSYSEWKTCTASNPWDNTIECATWGYGIIDSDWQAGSKFMHIQFIR